MILDALLKLSASQQVTADALSTNTVDLGDVTPKRQIGTGEPVGIGVFIKAIGTTSGSTKLQAVSSATADLGSATVLAEIPLATAGIAAGKAYFIAIPPGAPIQRYIGLYHDITGTVDYTVDAYYMPRSMFTQMAIAYAKGYNA